MPRRSTAVARSRSSRSNSSAFNGASKVGARFKAELERVLLSVPTEFGWQRTTWARELPKIGRDWMPKGHRRYVVTPGQNKKRFLAGALNAMTRKLTWVEATSKASEIFHKLLWKLASEYRSARRIHLIVDNYIIHSSRKTRRFLAQFGDRVVLHFLPPYCPDDNRIERVWLDLHANVTRNHRCRTIEELMVEVAAFLRAYNQRNKLNPSLKRVAGVSGSRSVV